MKHSRKIIWLAIAVVLAVLSVVLLWPEIQYRRALHKYTIGTPADAIERDYGIRLNLRSSGNILPSGRPGEDTEYEKRHHACFVADVPQDFAQIIFNNYREIIVVKRRTPLTKIRR